MLRTSSNPPSFYNDHWMENLADRAIDQMAFNAVVGIDDLGGVIFDKIDELLLSAVIDVPVHAIRNAYGRRHMAEQVHVIHLHDAVDGEFRFP